MKKFYILFVLLFLLEGAMAQMMSGDQIINEPLTGRRFTAADSLKKKGSRVPGFPIKPAHTRKARIPTKGMLKITTEIPSTLVYDGSEVQKMTCNHLVFIQSTPAGTHSLVFRNKALDYQTMILVNPGETGYLTLKKDTTITDSVIREKHYWRHDQKINSFCRDMTMIAPVIYANFQ